MYALVNEGNIKMLTRELLEYLKAADADFRPDLTAKICLLVQRFAPSKQWQFDSLLEVTPLWTAFQVQHVGLSIPSSGSVSAMLTASC